MTEETLAKRLLQKIKLAFGKGEKGSDPAAAPLKCIEAFCLFFFKKRDVLKGNYKCTMHIFWEVIHPYGRVILEPFDVFPRGPSKKIGQLFCIGK